MVVIRRQLQLVEYYGGASSVTAATARPDYVSLLNGFGTPIGYFGQVKSADITWDSTWSPHVQATIVVAQIASTDLAQWDPRLGRRLGFQLRQITDGVISDRYMNLMLRTRTVDWAAGTMTLIACSDEVQLQDYATGTPHTASIANNFDQMLINNLAAITWGGTSSLFQTAAGAPNPSMSVADQLWPAAVSAWDWITPLADANSIWIFVDEAGVPWQAPLLWNRGDATTHFLNDATAIKSVTDTISRDDPLWGNAVAITYSGNVNAGSGGVQIASATNGDQTWRKVLFLQSAKAAPSNSSAAATKIVNAAVKRGQVLTVTAIADIAARPCNTWSVTYGDTTHVGTCRSVTFHLPDGTMDLALNVTS